MAVEKAKKARDERKTTMNTERLAAMRKMDNAINRLWNEFGKQMEIDFETYKSKEEK